MEIPKFWENGFWTLRRTLSERQFLLALSVIIGLAAGSASILLKAFVFGIHSRTGPLLGIGPGSLFMALLPLCGMLLTVFLIRWLWPDAFRKGLRPVLESIRRAGGKLPVSQTYNHIVTAGITVGFGGSAGLESPIVSTGAALGSRLAEWLRVRTRDRVLLLTCGIAAGVSASFNAPIAGVLFAAEVFLTELSISALIPVILSSATGALLSKIVLNESLLLHFEMQEPFQSVNLPFYLFLGLLTGLLSLWFVRVFHSVSSLLQTISNPYRRALTAGALLGLLVLFFPALFGEGYQSIKDLATFHTYRLFDGSLLGNFINRKTWFFIAAVFLTGILKALATSLTLGGGGNGGQFAPSLFIGANTGFAFAMACHKLGFNSVSVSNFTIVGMAGVLTGVFYAPMTGIFLIAELTGGYDLMIPLMLVSALSYSVVRRFQPVSPEYQLSRQGPSGLANVWLQPAGRMMETDYDSLHPGMDLEEFTAILQASPHNTFPVVDPHQNLLGILVFSKVKEPVLQRDPGLKVRHLMSPPGETIAIDDSIPVILEKFDRTQAFRLPVVQDGRYLGFLTRAALLREFRDAKPVS